MYEPFVRVVYHWSTVDASSRQSDAAAAAALCCTHPRAAPEPPGDAPPLSSPALWTNPSSAARPRPEMAPRHDSMSRWVRPEITQTTLAGSAARARRQWSAAGGGERERPWKS